MSPKKPHTRHDDLQTTLDEQLAAKESSKKSKKTEEKDEKPSKRVSESDQAKQKRPPKKEGIKTKITDLRDKQKERPEKKKEERPEKKKEERPEKKKEEQPGERKSIESRKAQPTVKQPTPLPELSTTPPEPSDGLALSEIPGIGFKLEQKLVSAGYDSVTKLSRARADALSKRVDGLSIDGATKLIQSAKALLARKSAEKTVESTAEERTQEETTAGHRLEDIPGVGRKLALRLIEAGYDSIPRLSRTRPESVVASVSGLSIEKARQIVDAAREIIRQEELKRIASLESEQAPTITTTPERESSRKRTTTDAQQETAKKTTTTPSKQAVTAPPAAPQPRWTTRTKKRVTERPKPKRLKSGLAVPRPVLDLQKELRKKWEEAEKSRVSEDITKTTVEVQELDRKEAAERLVECVIDILNETMTTGRPSFDIPSRAGDNIVWDEFRDLLLLGTKTLSRPYHSLASVVDATRTARIMEIVFQLLRANLHATKRELYYTDVNLFRDQKFSDRIIEDVASMLSTTRDSIHIVASARGSAMGRVVIRDSGDTIDLTKMGTGGWAITPFLDQVEIVESDAEFIILSEKDAAVMRLAEAKYWNRMPCIVITGKGSGDMATRAFLKRLVRELEIPAFALVDSDPYGHAIFSVFLRGSKRLSYESPFIATPELKLLGVLCRDLDEYKIPKSVRVPMTPADIKRVKDMLREPFVQSNKAWVADLELMLRMKEKAEIQAFASHSFEYLIDEYIPRKLESGDWI